jgi:hypothetical protein
MRLARTLIAGVVLAGAVAAVFGPGTRGGFVWDDHSLITNNAHLRSGAGLGQLLRSGFWDTTAETQASSSYYRPVVSLAYFAQFQAFGLRPLGYHAVNLALHAACVLLVFAWLRRRLSHLDERGAYAGAFAGAALFALHPTRTESVTWISGCTDLWMTALCLLALLVLRDAASALRLALAAGLAALAFLSKEAAVVLPVLIALDALLLAAPGPERGARLRASGAVAAGIAIALALRLSLVPLPQRSAHALLWSLPARVASSLGHYLSATLWPFAPTALRGKVALGADGALVYEPLSVMIGAAGIAAALGFGLRALRRPALRPWLADAAWFAVALLPVLNLFPLELKALVADRFLYFPLIGVAALAARAIATSWPRLRAPARGLIAACGAALALAFAPVVLAQGRAFASDAALWRYEFARDPQRPLVLELNATLAAAARDHARAVALARAGHELALHDRQPGLEVRFALLALDAAARATPDLDQPRLSALRDFYDALALRGQGELALPAVRAGARELAPALALRVKYDALRRKLLDQEVANFHVPRARLHARTLGLARAEELLVAITRAHPRSFEARVELALVQGKTRQLAAARGSVAAARALAPAHPSVVAAERALGTAAQLAARSAVSDTATALREAQIDLLLGAPEQARRRLDPLLAVAAPEPALIALRAQVDALDRRADLARARVEQARRMQPDAEPRWRALLAELASVR